MPRNAHDQRPFLTARWRRLILAQYEADPALLTPRLPAGLKLDTWQDHVYVSVVAFEFLDTRVKGIRVPGCVNFPEVNLRFYVTDGERRGVCFVRELVPSRLTSFVARAVYIEPYARAAMSVSTAESDGDIHIDHRFRFGGKEHRIGARVSAERHVPEQGSPEHHFKEHEWGFGRTRRGAPTLYRVEHPVWATHRVLDTRIDIDAGALYGDEWAWLGDAEPHSVVVADGSEVAVYPWTQRD
ncbi:MAG: DUF2071 domain-containing protein [Phycisphaerales bacterium]